MPLVPAKCTNCGGTLEVDSVQQAAICPHCESAFIVEQAINNYNVTNVTNINAEVLNVVGGETADVLSERADTFVKISEFGRADECYTQMRQKFPADPRGWAGRIRVLTKDYTKMNVSGEFFDQCLKMYDKFIVLSKSSGKIDETINSKIQMVLEQLIVAMRNSNEEFKANTEEAQKNKVGVTPNDAKILAEKESKVKKADKTVIIVDIFALILGIAFCGFCLILAISRFEFIGGDLFDSFRDMLEIGVGVVFKPIMFSVLLLITVILVIGVGVAICNKIDDAINNPAIADLKSFQEEYDRKVQVTREYNEAINKYQSMSRAILGYRAMYEDVKKKI